MSDVLATLDASKLSRTQIVAITLTAIINSADAYDVLTMAFVAPEVAVEWRVNKAALGLALSSGFVGMVLGSLFLSPLADRYGRRKIILTTLALMAFGMTMAALSRSVVELAVWRVVTGLGLGALVPINTPLAVEYANAARRRLALAVMAIGFPLGATLGGFVAAALLYYASWQSVFLTGAAFSVAMLVAAYFLLPEPPAFLIARRPPNALAKLNEYLRRCGHRPVVELPGAPDDGEVKRTPYRVIFSRRHRASTVMLSLANFMFLMTVYYVLSWTPKMVADLGYSSSFATMTSSTSALFGVASSLAYGFIRPQAPTRVIAAATMIGLAVLTSVFGRGSFTPTALLGLAAVLGLFLYGGTVSVYGTIVDNFAPAVRTTGVGFAMGMGRIAGVIAPALAGQLFYSGMSRLGVSLIMSFCAVISAGLILASSRFVRR